MAGLDVAPTSHENELESLGSMTTPWEADPDRTQEQLYTSVHTLLILLIHTGSEDGENFDTLRRLFPAAYIFDVLDTWIYCLAQNEPARTDFIIADGVPLYTSRTHEPPQEKAKYTTIRRFERETSLAEHIETEIGRVEYLSIGGLLLGFSSKSQSLELAVQSEIHGEKVNS